MKNSHHTNRISLLDERIQIEFRPEECTLILSFNDPKTRNAMNGESAKALAEFCRAFQTLDCKHSATRFFKSTKYLVLVLKSEIPGVFLAGGDLKSISQFDDAQGELFTLQMREFTDFLRSGALISIAQLNGVAAGGGCEVALACDMRVATSANARLDLAQTRWGVPAGWGMMSDFSRHGVYASERRRSLAMIAQERWSLDRLETLGLIDARFDQSPNPMDSYDAWLSQILLNISQCPPELFDKLIVDRPRCAPQDLEEFDKKLFSEFWLKETHKARISSYFRNRQPPQKE